MPRFIANLTMLFTELPLLDRIAAAARAGFEGVEILWPYEDPADLAQIKAALQSADLPLVLINMPRGSIPETHWGMAAIPGHEALFRDQAQSALRFAKALSARHIHVIAGQSGDITAEVTFVHNLRWLCDHAPGQNFTIEPLSPAVVADYFLSNFDRATRIIRAVDRPNLGLQFDLFHASQLGDWRKIWAKVAPLTTHIQIANPGTRHAPDGTEVAAFLAAIPPGYQGDIAAEYTPAGRTEDSLGWLADARKNLAS